MRRDPTEFRERFKNWKETGEYNLPHFKDGLEDELYTNYPIPFIKDKAVTLTNAGLATGARLSTNMLDSIADNAVKAELPIKTAIGLAVKESTLGNPTDDRSIYKLLRPSMVKRFKLWGTGQHINTKGDWVFGDELINYYINERNKWPNGYQYSKDTHYPSTLYMGFKYFKNNPRKYNPGQKNHPELVERRAKETWKSPEVLKWFDDYNKQKTEYLKRPKPYKVTTDWNALPHFRGGRDGNTPEPIYVERTDATTVQRQKPIQPIKRQYGKVVDPKLVERKQKLQSVIKKDNTYKVKPRPQTFAGRVTQVVGGDWIKADMASAGASQIPVIGQLNGALDFGYDLNNSAHNALDIEANTNTAMSGLALLPYVRNGLKMLKGKTYIDRLRNAYDQFITKYNTSREVNKALKTARTSDAIQDGTAGVFDQYAKEWFNNEVSFIRPYRSSGGKGNTVGDVIDYNLGLFGGRDKPLSELTDNQRYRIAVMLSKDKEFPKGTRVIHMDDSGPQPVNNVGFVPKDASNSNSVWNSSLSGLPEIWWNRGIPYYNAKGYPSIQDIPRTIISDIEDLKRSGITLEGTDVLHGPGVVPFQSIQYGIQPNPFGWFDRIKFIGQ